MGTSPRPWRRCSKSFVTAFGPYGHETGSEAFGKGKLRISGAAPHVADDFNEGVKFLTMAIDKFRNES